MFSWLTMHGNHFKHHFSMIYIIFNHIESYTKDLNHIQISFLRYFLIVPKYQNILLNFFKHEVFMLFH